MNVVRVRNLLWALALLLPGLWMGCRFSGSEVEPEVTLPPPTRIQAPAEASPTEEARESAATATMPATVAVPPATPTPPPTMTGAPGPIEEHYAVSFVEPDDVLNMRTGPGVENEVVAELTLGTSNIEVTGPGSEIDGSLWVPISANGSDGWVNSRFLTLVVDEDLFCQDEKASALLDELKTAVAARDGQALARLVHQERGLRIRRHWWNPEVKLTGQDVTSLFASSESHFWGTADGSGEDITGPFSEVILPLMDRNLLPASEIGCNEVLHGGTAGLVQLPALYEDVRYYSLFRPAKPDEIELDWGSWVVGIENWQGNYYISYLVHYEWEI